MKTRRSRAIRTVPLLDNDSPFLPDTVEGPEVRGGEGGLVVTYLARDEETRVRVTFEGLDSYRVARGEYSPYWSEANDDYSTVALVQNSPWLIERHAYESAHYGDAYEWGRGADSMLLDTHHFLFLFHDEFVEVLARGVRFERPSDQQASGPPFTGAPTETVEDGEHRGVRFRIRADLRPSGQMESTARFASQLLFDVCIDGAQRASLEVRVRIDPTTAATRAWLAGPLGTEQETFDRVPSLAEVRPLIHRWLDEVADRRASPDAS